MAELSTLARPYAKAAFEYAVEAKDVQGWSDNLSLAASVAQQPAVEKLLSSPSATAEKQAEAVQNICGDELATACQNFISILSENRRLQLLPQISQQFEIMKANYKNGNYGYGHAKQALYELIIDKFAVPRQRYNHFMSHLNEIDDALALGAEKAKIVANTVLKRVREKAGY